jgi:restriction endonuclease S subunit
MAIAFALKLSQLEGQKRIDPEYYQPEYSNIRHKLSQIKTKQIKELSASVVSFGAYSLCNYIIWREKGVPYLNVENIKEGYINWEGVKYIDEDVNEILKKSQVKEGQVIITMAGTIGNSAVAYKLPKKVNSNQATAKITLKPNSISPFFLAAFLNSYWGKKQTEWEIVTSVQPNIFLWQIKKIKVPIVSKEIENEIEKIYRHGLNQLELSKSFYSQAELLLLEELGLKDFMPKYEKTYTAKLSDAFSAHRIDAEYFQPAYEEVVEKLAEICKIEKLKNIVSFVNHGKQPYYVEDGEIFIITQKHLGNQLLSLASEILTMPDTPKSDRNFLKHYPDYKLRLGDILFYSVGAYLGRTNVLLEDLEAVPASFITLIRTKQEICNPLYLALFLNSKIGQLQSQRWKSASAQQYIYPKEIKKFIIPLLPLPTQQRIASLVQQSHEARKKAKELLEVAKKAVEIAIENNEKEALDYISKAEEK